MSDVLIIEEGVTTIPKFEFQGRTDIKSIIIPASVTKISGTFTFEGCINLDSIIVDQGNTVYDSREDCNAIIETSTNTLLKGCSTTIIPNSVTTIGESAFENSPHLTSITIPNSVTTIERYAFSLTSLTSISIPNSVTTIGESAFGNNPFLTSITIPNSVTTIDGGAFKGCNKLTSIVIPTSVTTIGWNIFFGCTGLKEIICESTTPIKIKGDTFSKDIQKTVTLKVPKKSIEIYKKADGWKDFSTIVPIEK